MHATAKANAEVSSHQLDLTPPVRADSIDLRVLIGHRTATQASASPRVWNRRLFTMNYTSGLHSQSVQSSIGIARMGTFVAVVIETPSTRRSQRVVKLLPSSPRTHISSFAVPKTQSTIHRRYNQILPVAAMRVGNPDRSPPGING